ncbi:hypothetical protein BDW67DRAFT_188746 [Aspergillus spinulosporus]
MTTAKETFFRGLEQLDSLSDDSECEFDRIIASSSGNDGAISSCGACQTGSLSHVPQPSVAIDLRTSSDTAPAVVSSISSISSSTSIVEIASLEQTAQEKTVSPKHPTTKVPAKRKRGGFVARTIPEQLQIFKGLVFFFFPNSDVSPLRRLRIQRAQEYGALWAKTWGSHVTHIIVDKGLNFEEIRKHLELETIPPNVAVVDEAYPADCIKFRCILSVTQGRFQVKGAPSAEPPRLDSLQPEGPSMFTQRSPPLKPDRKQLRQTQRSSQLSVQEDPLLEQAPQPDIYYEAGEKIIRGSFADREHDALDDVVEEAKATKHLPLDPLDSSDDESAAENSGHETSDESQSPPAKTKSRELSLGGNRAAECWQQKFQMQKYYTQTADHWCALAYRKAISSLRNQSMKVLSRSEAIRIPGIGERLADKIEEIVLTDRLRRLDNTSNTVEDRLLQTYLGVYGAGITVASRWIAQGYRSLEDLRTKASLTQAQRIGLDHYFDFSQRIPRSEVLAHGNLVRRVVQMENPDMQVIIGGSYRRGAATSGDIDLLITGPNATIEEIRTLMLDNVVPKLFEQGYLQAGLAATCRGEGSKWHGASKLPDGQLWRRIDLLFVPGAELGVALIYFTGNDIFNRSIRLLASKKFMRLNQRGLYADALRGSQWAKANPGRLLESRDERRIFELLGVPWRPPEHRNC